MSGKFVSLLPSSLCLCDCSEIKFSSFGVKEIHDNMFDALKNSVLPCSPWFCFFFSLFPKKSPWWIVSTPPFGSRLLLITATSRRTRRSTACGGVCASGASSRGCFSYGGSGTASPKVRQQQGVLRQLQLAQVQLVFRSTGSSGQGAARAGSSGSAPRCISSEQGCSSGGAALPHR